jgi:hypothetical protein
MRQEAAGRYVHRARLQRTIYNRFQSLGQA